MRLRFLSFALDVRRLNRFPDLIVNVRRPCNKKFAVALFTLNDHMKRSQNPNPAALRNYVQFRPSKQIYRVTTLRECFHCQPRAVSAI